LAAIWSLTFPQKHQQSAASDFSVHAANLRTLHLSIPTTLSDFRRGVLRSITSGR